MCASMMIVRVFLLLCVAGAAHGARAGAASVVINEFLAANGRFHADPQGEHDDWVELYNPTGAAVDVGGMYLTDDPAVPMKWQIPTDMPSLTRIAAKGYLIIWLDNDVGDPGLHASFKLSAEEDWLALFDRDGMTLLDLVGFEDQRADVSYGRHPTDADSWRYLVLPTPGASNTIAYEGVVADMTFDRERGFYDEPFTVTITTETPGAEIYYTVDGSSPLDIARSVPTGRPYTEPIPITTTTCLRAVAYRHLWLPSKIDAHTYIFPAHVATQATDPQTGAQVTPPGFPTSWGSARGDYQVDPDVVGPDGKDKFNGLYARTIQDDLKAVPTVSLVMDKDDWFGPTGIYIHQSQDGTERVCSLEWIDPHGAGGFQINCAIAMQGGADKTNPASGTSLDRWKVFKLSMRPRFKTHTDDGKPTGGPGQLNYRVFPDSPVGSFDTFVLDGVLTNAWNHSGQHMYGTYIQDQYVSDLHNAMGGHSPHGLYAHLYINGLYWGMYYVHERPDHSWAAQMFGGDKEEYDAIRHNSGITINDGLGGKAANNFHAMLAVAAAVASAPGDMTRYDALCGMLDIDNFITDLLARWYATNWDWPEKNWYATHRSPDGLWRFHTWDAEHSMEYWDSRNVLGRSVSSLHDRLKKNPEYGLHFADLVHRFFFNDGALTYPRTAEMYRARMAQIDRAIVGESARWGDTRSTAPHTRADWLANQNQVLARFIQPRSAFVLSWLRNADLYPNVDAPVFHIDGTYQHGGHAEIGAQLSLHDGEGVTWCTLDGRDPRVPGPTPGPGATATDVSPTAIRYSGPIRLSQSTFVKARSLSNGVWSALNEAVFAVGPVAESLRISEIMYHPAGDANAEYIELTNAGSQTINLNLVRFTQGIQCTLPGYELPAGSCCLLVRDTWAFEAVYGSGLPVLGEYTGSLSNGGERIELVDAAGAVVESLQYQDNWHDPTDGAGFSLTILDPRADGGDAAHWQAALPSPGRMSLPMP